MAVEPETLPAPAPEYASSSAEVSRTERLVQVVAPLLPAVLMVGLFTVWALKDAGYPAAIWYPGALFSLGLLAVVAWSYRGSIGSIPRSTLAALACLGAFTAWTFLSIAWAGVGGEAWDGANRTLLYLTVFGLFAFVPWRAGNAAIVLGLYSTCVAAVGAKVFLDVAGDPSPVGFFIEGRLAEPAGYPNASCALFLIAFWPALFLASRRETPWPFRGALLAISGLLLQLGLLSQSRGLLVAVPIALVVYLAFVPGRTRSIVFLLPVAVATVHWIHPLLNVYSDFTGEGNVHNALIDARSSMVRSFIALLVVGSVAAFVDRRFAIPPSIGRWLDRGIAIAAGLVALAALVAFLVVGHPRTTIEDAWQEFKANRSSDTSGSHFGSGLGSSRYDVWRVALNEFTSAPIVGVGVDNFSADYLRERRTEQEPLYPHSIELRLLSQTGIVGTCLFAGFLGFALFAIWRARSRGDPWAAALAACTVVPFAYWFVHGSIDWFWEFPGLSAPIFAWVGMGGRIGSTPEVRKPLFRRKSLVVATAAVAGAAVLACGASYAFPALATTEVQRAASHWRDDPAAAFAQLDRARALNPLSDEPDLVAGAIASRLGDWARMRQAFAGALRRNPENWYAHLELAIVASLQHRRAAAFAHLARARDLNPGEPTLRILRRRLLAGKLLSPRTVDRIFVARVVDRAR